MPRFTALLILTASALLGACGQSSAPAPADAAPPEVDVATPLKRSLVEWDEFTGRFEATDRVDIRARVTGYLNEVRFRDGQLVESGDVLFVIDPRPFEFELQRAEAQFTLAEKAYRRAEDLYRKQSIAQELYDQRVQELAVSRAALGEAKMNLEFTEVRAPIDGKISDAFVDTGNLVNANDTVLTRIVSIDPIHFEFEGSQADLLKYQRLDRAGKRPSSDSSPNPIFIKLLDEGTYAHRGRMDFVDNVVDTGTGTIKGRALVENPEAIIYPGLFGRARLLGSGEYEALLLPQHAVNTDQSRKYVYAVDAEGRAVRRYVELGPTLDNGLVIIREGLAGDERVVVNGVQRIRVANQTVTPTSTPLQWQETDTMPDPGAVPSLEAIAHQPEDPPEDIPPADRPD